MSNQRQMFTRISPKQLKINTSIFLLSPALLKQITTVNVFFLYKKLDKLVSTNSKSFLVIFFLKISFKDIKRFKPLFSIYWLEKFDALPYRAISKKQSCRTFWSILFFLSSFVKTNQNIKISKKKKTHQLVNQQIKPTILSLSFTQRAFL